ncbi:DUF1254 domain-containing protein [Streptomyces sp. NPDC004609]|uniref:DUF1254 domain-containing protein n=1 Tax=Streptomyces sp. NPDC004609 TaxID=3364704 RepID=UPI0036A70AD5
MAATAEFRNGYPTHESARAVLAETELRRAVEAYRYFYPTVSLEGVLQGTRDAGAVDNSNALLFIARPHHLGFTLNSDTPYSVGVLDLRRSGPMVIDLPPGPLIGLVDDHHHRWLTDLGLPGAYGSKGGRHLLLPPGHEDRLPEKGYTVVRSDSWTVFCTLRALPVRGDVETAKKALSATRFHPLSRSDDPPPYTFTDHSDRPADWTCLRWEDNLDFWRVLHGVIDSEPPVEEMRPMLGLLAELGIEAGKPFAPDGRMAGVLSEAARRGRDGLLVSAFASVRPDRLVWPDRTWEWAGLRPENGSFEREGSLDIEAKDRWFAQAIVASPAMFRRAVGQGSLYWLGLRDREGTYLDGGRAYRLTVPLPVPATLFWSLTVYDAQTRSEIVTDQGRAALRSLFDGLTPEYTPSVDLFFGPTEPPGGPDRWIRTTPGRGWFSYFRVYGPEQAAFNGSWRPGDFERTDRDPPAPAPRAM